MGADLEELLLLDDPTAGLDPLVRREVLEGILDAVHADGGAVVYASHLVHDVERVADRVAVMGAGGYGFAMASNYNTRPRAAEVMVSGESLHLIGQRESLNDLWQREHIPEGFTS